MCLFLVWGWVIRFMLLFEEVIYTKGKVILDVWRTISHML